MRDRRHPFLREVFQKRIILIERPLLVGGLSLEGLSKVGIP